MRKGIARPFSDGKWTLGDVRPVASFAASAGGGSVVELNAPGHGGIALVTWRLDSEGRSPDTEAKARYIMTACAVHDDLVEALKVERRAVDWLMRRLIVLDPQFVPSAMPYTVECRKGLNLLTKMEEQ